jgi:hypothetical protein
MSLALVYWILMLLWLVTGLWWHWEPATTPLGYAPLGLHVFLFILLLILGWGVFGTPVHG